LIFTLQPEIFSATLAVMGVAAMGWHALIESLPKSEANCICRAGGLIPNSASKVRHGHPRNFGAILFRCAMPAGSILDPGLGYEGQSEPRGACGVQLSHREVGERDEIQNRPLRTSAGRLPMDQFGGISIPRDCDRAFMDIGQASGRTRRCPTSNPEFQDVRRWGFARWIAIDDPCFKGH
jgi:hypothetical protein